MFKNMKLASKIGWGFGVIILIAILLGSLALFNMTQMAGQLTLLSQEYEKLRNETMAQNRVLAKELESSDEGARKRMQACYSFLKSQEEKLKQATAAGSSAAQALSRSSTVMGFGSIAAVVASIFLAVFTTKSIARPMQRVIAGLTGGAEQISSASEQVSSANRQLAQGSGDQASSLEETSASLEEMASMTRQNADNATQANHIAKETSALAAVGVEAMTRMIEAIDKIKNSSVETAKIIKTIDEIAFQTNLLALNAAVEAARAGEAGKGFAVVAEEVRNLARRSAEAAKNTADLIEGAQKNSEQGVAVTSEVAQSLSGIKDAANKVATLIAEIAAATKEQSLGIDQVNAAVAEMDKVVQQNAANSEESASASKKLTSQAQELTAMVAELAAIIGDGHDAEPAIAHRPASATPMNRSPLPSRKAATEAPTASFAAHNDQPPKSKKPLEKTSIRPEEVIPLDDEEFKEFF
ncbi:MAG TPA: hypothetical protein DCZ95_11545 [Verrucomicrobia bacterium]|nr:MAG: hypothetical protein A2X46_04055 [Lentisphaerae bacterium GWF2_57_35]HBA84718.1 hypothetical protein [Verrucomicrobiota bacterium]